MRFHKLFVCLLIATSFLMITACGGGGGGDPIGYGELAIAVTDAKPLLPDGVTNFYVKFTEVLAHGKGGWESLPLPQDPYTIDLLQFSDGVTTELVPPVLLRSGKYTQIRLVLDQDGEKIRFNNDDKQKYTVVVPPEYLKTDKNIDFDVESDRAVDLLIDFDLSQSLVVTDDGSGTLSYKLKPVLHIVNFFEAATITGIIDDASFASFNTYTANITVLANSEIYTEVTVGRNQDPGVPAEFTIFWLVPNKDYRVEIDFDYVTGSETNAPEWCENVDDEVLQPGVDFVLNGEDGPITPSPVSCTS